jgi:hypothetical protein
MEIGGKMNIATAIVVFGLIAGMPGTETKVEVNPIVVVNNEQVLFQDVLPIIRDSRTLIPLRGVFEKLGFDIQWDAGSNTATLRKGELIITLTIGDEAIIANRERKVFDVPPQIIQDRFMVPLRAISELSGARVDWIDEDKTVMITTDDGAVVVIPTVTPAATPIVEATPTPTPIVVEGELPEGAIEETKMELNGITFYLGESQESIEMKFGQPNETHFNGDYTLFRYNGTSLVYSSTDRLVRVFIKDISFSHRGYSIPSPYDIQTREFEKDESISAGMGYDYDQLVRRFRGVDGNIIYKIQLMGNGVILDNIYPTAYTDMLICLSKTTSSYKEFPWFTEYK